MSNALQTEVRDFLIEVKQTIAQTSIDYQSWHFIGRMENINCMSKLGLTFEDVRNVILSLSVEDYCEGPLQDVEKIPGDLWVFGKSIANTEIYIKLKLASFGRLRVVRIISFHTAKQPLSYPYKEKERR